MTEEPSRPDPDRLLARAGGHHRGKLKIFFGACAGVGKTYAMLAEARRRHAQGLDVLVGAVYNLSRSSADKFFLQQKVFVNGRCIENRAHTVQPGDKISVRGHGRFTAGAPLRRTKKDRLVVPVEVY